MKSNFLDRNLALEAVRITEVPALASSIHMGRGDVMFSATGVTDGTLLKGVNFKNNTAITNSVVMRSKTKTIRYVNAKHNLNIKNIKF